MRDVTIQIEGVTPYSASKPFDVELQKGEERDAHDLRRWREKAHVNKAGVIYIPGVSFKLALDEAAAKISRKIKGKGNQTYTGLFKSGVAAMNDVELGIHIDKVEPISLYVSSNGIRGAGGGSRVTRWFPFIPRWSGVLEMKIFDDTIPESIFEEFFTASGLVAGVGRGRPSTGCAAGNGRYQPKAFAWG